MDVALAIDIGGTRIKAGLLRRDGTLLVSKRCATPEKAPPEIIVKAILGLVAEIQRESKLRPDQTLGLGISIACFITAEGLVTATAHLSQAWLGYDLRARLLQEMDMPYYFALDTPAPTLGEAYYGAGRGHRNFCYVTVSTGIGAGIFADGRYFSGGLGWAGGLGHIIVDETSPRVCAGCGNHGCLETFAATQGILETARVRLNLYPDSPLIAALNSGTLTPHLIHDAALAGDPAAVAIWQEVGHTLGIGLVSLIDIVSPTRVVIGGGIAQAGDLLLDPARKVVRERGFPPQHRQAEIVQAELGDLSGLYGAAAMVFYDIRVNATEQTSP
jgi:glucokinase